MNVLFSVFFGVTSIITMIKTLNAKDAKKNPSTAIWAVVCFMQLVSLTHYLLK
jgi:hypothetical protein